CGDGRGGAFRHRCGAVGAAVHGAARPGAEVSEAAIAVPIPARRLRAVRRLDLAGRALSVLGLALALVWAFPLYWSTFTTVVPHGPSSGSLVTDIANAIGLYAKVLVTTEIGTWYLNSIV